MRVVLIGSGNTATVLGRKIAGAEHAIVQVYSRQATHAQALAEEFDCDFTSQWAGISQKADLYIVALSDQAINDLHQNWATPAGLVVHTAGSVSLNALKGVAKNYGVLYPLQSLRKEKTVYGDIPVLIDANTPGQREILRSFAQTFTTITGLSNDADRERLHLAAVLVNNFTNHLYALAEDYCLQQSLDFNLLKPLILETAERIVDFSPKEVQTGPAVRQDNGTINKHLGLLTGNPELTSLYTVLTDSIVQLHQRK